ncbi:hypothetical protein FHQ18_09610 [Deferribacter autotrophicus]|uniref:Uncharacterized protein n=1 Tax=Deferribacter autotrophicus TaxID=500465 RepID=A0A5A8EZZ8_9BACT|nr:hypothetical protein [Deferribacter autotrophicus]KAA0257296.1 hypothetical protein FHQ18_09610 [Deferribacter autotrophicus]
MKYWCVDVKIGDDIMVKLKPEVVNLLKSSPTKKALRLSVEVLKEKYSREWPYLFLDCPFCYFIKDCRDCLWKYIIDIHFDDIPCISYLEERNLLQLKRL